MRNPGSGIEVRRGVSRAVLAAAAAFALSGCIASQKQVDLLEADVTRRSAWTDEQVESLRQELTQVRSENEALRLRMDDLADQLVSLGGEVSTRITELESTDREVQDEIRASAEELAGTKVEQERDREEVLDRLNLVLEEVVAENEKLRGRIESLEDSQFMIGKMHEVAAGETVASIASQYGVTADAIVEANGLADPSLIHVGQQLLIPGGG